jgi:hypothetical protein
MTTAEQQLTRTYEGLVEVFAEVASKRSSKSTPHEHAIAAMASHAPTVALARQVMVTT